MDPEVAGHARPRTFAVVLNYRTARATITAVRSLQASTDPPVSIIVVDNASGDDSPQRVRSDAPDIQLVVSAVNGGFSAGCNVGIRAALEQGASRVLVLNSDVEVPRDTLSVLERVFDREPGVGVAAPIVTRRSDPQSIESAGISYSLATGRMRHHGHNARQSGRPRAAFRDVDGVSGSAMFVRREVFEAVGLFAEEYFYGFEDLEFCLRAKTAGFRTVCVGDAVVEHEGGASIGRDSPRRLYFAARNHLLLASRVGSQAWPLRAARATNIVGLNVAHALVRSNGRIVPSLAAIGRGVRDHLRGRYVTDRGREASKARQKAKGKDR